MKIHHKTMLNIDIYSNILNKQYWRDLKGILMIQIFNSMGRSYQIYTKA